MLDCALDETPTVCGIFKIIKWPLESCSDKQSQTTVKANTAICNQPFVFCALYTSRHLRIHLRHLTSMKPSFSCSSHRMALYAGVCSKLKWTKKNPPSKVFFSRILWPLEGCLGNENPCFGQNRDLQTTCFTLWLSQHLRYIVCLWLLWSYLSEAHHIE